MSAFARSIRFASTAPSPQPTIVAEPVLQPSIPPPNDNLPELQDLVALATEPEVARHIGFLKELGLDFGWGPTALVEWILEHVHVYAGTPWWASIIIAMLTIRFTIFKTYIESADVSARLLVIKPQIQEIRDRIDEAKRTQDMVAVMQSSQEMKNLYKAAGVQTWKGVLPFVNLPMGYGLFRLTKDMASLPVPGLESGGILWFTDLTLSDPTFLLPLGTGAATYFMFKLGGELGSATTVNPAMMKFFQYGTQTPSVAALKGVMVPPSPPLVQPEAEKAQGGVFRNASSKIKSTVSGLKNSAQVLSQEDQAAKTSSRRSSKELDEARRYDEKRRKEIEQDKIHRTRHPRS
ncbi:MAG: hypothetical protein Q9182_002712 [Xanthomendoza sp. 2 TL-2023]